MNVRLLYPAEIEMLDAVEFYERQVPGLGDRFLSIVEGAVHGLCEQPYAWPDLGGGIRKRPLRRFPYSLFYRADENEVVVIAVAHQKRRPHYWIERLR